MPSNRLIQSVANSNFQLSEFLALEHIELDPNPGERSVPFLDRHPLALNSDRTLEQLSVAAGNPYHYGVGADGGFYKHALVLDQDITVRTAIANLRNRLAHATSFFQELDFSASTSRTNGNPRDIAIELLHEVASYFTVIEIAAVEEHGRQVQNSLPTA
ncbi:hypothetical protein [Roseateles sp. L2-2]|uniref:hypothetical protein n=1 Tax=Roseateles TaxID=93681 RepID=UPI000B4D8710|nr:hypothetical protein CDL60_01425 [Roseateles noduli]